MKRMRKLACAVALGLLSATTIISGAALAAAEATGAALSDYIIGAGDMLHIAVWKDEALTRQVVVLPDGKIGFPLIGQVTAAGKTVAELSVLIASL